MLGAMKWMLAAGLLAAVASSVQAQTGPRRPPSTEPAPRRTAASEPATRDCAAQGALPAAWEGQAFALDGNTLGGIGLKPNIRIWGIQAPELRDAAKAETVAGMRTRAALEDLLDKSDHKIKCRAMKFDRDCQIVAQCSLDDSQAGDIGGALVANGLAYGFDLHEALPWEARASQRYASAEAEARKQRRGLWKEWLGEK